MLTLKKIFTCLEEFCGEGNVVFKKGKGSTLVTVYCNGNKIMYLVKSYCSGWVCLLNFTFDSYDTKPFLIKSDNINRFESFIETIDVLSGNYLSDFRRAA